MKEEQPLRLDVEELEERIAPSGNQGQLGYEGQPGNQGNGLKVMKANRATRAAEIIILDRWVWDKSAAIRLPGLRRGSR